MSRQAVLWGMDGVLVDTGDAHYESWKALLTEFGIPFGLDFFRETFGMNNAGVLGALLGDKLTPQLETEISDRKEEAFRDAIRGHAQPLPGVRFWVKRLAEEGFRQGIASSAPQENIDVLVGELGLGEVFDVIVSGANLPGKPEPVLFLEVARLLGASAECCVVVEDAVAGVEAAKRAGMACIAVTTTNPAEALAAADVVVNRLDVLPQDAFQRVLDRGSG